jgi:hypothetical protein
MTDFGTFKINSVIMHRVPRARKSEKELLQPDLTEATIQLTDNDRRYLNLRMQATLSGRARPIVEDPGVSSPVPDLVRELFADKAELVPSSQTVALRLHNEQDGISSGGLLVMVDGELESERAILISKIEHEQGMRVEPSLTHDGRRTYKAQYLRDLIFGENTRVFKIGVFPEAGAVGELLRGHVVDTQQTTYGVAQFFVSRVLGCKFAERPDVLTERFLKTAEKWINKKVSDPERTASYEVALISEMQSKSPNISVDTFAAQHIDDRDDPESLRAAMQEAGVPLQSMQKDVTLVRSQIRRVKLHTIRNATVYVPPDMYQDGSASIRDIGDNRSEIRIVDEIKSVHGASGPRQGQED